MSVWQLVHAWTRARKDVLTCEDKAKLPALIVELGKHEHALYEHAVIRRHHPWCNDHNPVWPGPVSECSMCPALFRDHPVLPGDTPDDLMARHFPDNAREVAVTFLCTGCGVEVTTYRWVNYRTIPPSKDERDLCERCKAQADASG